MMITFKQFLVEARMAPLYHGTNIARTNGILMSGTLKASDGDSSGNKTVSFTRSFKYAKKWIDELGFSPRTQVILELDQLALSRNYKLVPYNFFSTQVPHKYAKARYLNDDPVWGTNEYEERIYKRDIKNIDRYLTAIHIFDLEANDALGHHFLVKYNGKFINQ